MTCYCCGRFDQHKNEYSTSVPDRPARAPDPAADVLLIVDGDAGLLQSLASAMRAIGLTVSTARSVAEALARIKSKPPKFAVVDVRLADGSGLDVIEALKQRRPDARAVIQTSYGNIATAVCAVKVGAIDYLIKPATPDDVRAVLLTPDGCTTELPERVKSANRVRWEHIQHIYERCGRNVSETARQLNMHRRTLQRVLAKREPR